MFCFVFFFKQKTAYEMRISDWSSDVCSSDLPDARPRSGCPDQPPAARSDHAPARAAAPGPPPAPDLAAPANPRKAHRAPSLPPSVATEKRNHRLKPPATKTRSEEHTSELQSLMRISYAVFCLKKKKQQITQKYIQNTTN